MKNKRHTPGPWRILPEECDRPYIRVRGTMCGGRFKVANVLTPVYEGVPEREADETRANACLIAAAPEMLEALVYLLRVTDPYRTGGMQHQREAFSISVAIIEKATGMKIEEVLK